MRIWEWDRHIFKVEMRSKTKCSSREPVKLDAKLDDQTWSKHRIWNPFSFFIRKENNERKPGRGWNELILLDYVRTQVTYFIRTKSYCKFRRGALYVVRIVCQSAIFSCGFLTMWVKLKMETFLDMGRNARLLDIVSQHHAHQKGNFRVECRVASTQRYFRIGCWTIFFNIMVSAEGWEQHAYFCAFGWRLYKN